MGLIREPLRNRSGITPARFMGGKEWKRRGIGMGSLFQDQVDNVTVGAAPLGLVRGSR